ncbi:MAG: hypothetical protein EOM20_18575 [Spartobacteria bacterium]|nr:hypothetical protein [Spartobacteria bacterium]
MIHWVMGILSVMVTWLIGYNLVATCLRTERYFQLSLGWPLGSGVVSLLVFAVYLCGGALGGWFIFAQLLVLAGTIVLRRACRQACVTIDTPPPLFSNFAGAWLLRALLGLVLLAVLVRAITSPALRFDEIHDWGFKALSTAVLGKPFQDRWPLMLFPNHIPFLGASVHLAMPSPRETVVHIIPFMYYLSLAGCFHYAVVYMTRERAWALPLTFLLLMGMPELQVQSDRLVCDLPMASIMFASFVCALFWVENGRWPCALLAGLLAGLCAWTKTDGIILAAGTGGALVVGGWLEKERRSQVIRAALIFGGAALLVIAPWYLFLHLADVALDSSGHVGSFQADRWPIILHRAGLTIQRYYVLSTLAFVLFLLSAWYKCRKGRALVIIVVVAAGFFHALFPLFLLPDDAFGGWQRFMRVGISRYFLHFAPVMMVAIAAVAYCPWFRPLTRLFRLFMLGRNK